MELSTDAIYFFKGGTLARASPRGTCPVQAKQARRTEMIPSYLAIFTRQQFDQFPQASRAR